MNHSEFIALDWASRLTAHSNRATLSAQPWLTPTRERTLSPNQYRPQLTDERLRTWLDANQLDRERMCLALVALDVRFHDVRPRHPRGGRDGGRDLEAALEDGRRVWAAVGFQNGANDSDGDKKWVNEKFKDDLDRALEVDPALKAFIFLTNVELTVGERDALAKKAKKRGIEFVDIFHRERLRILLDSPDGLAARYQYLGIPLSEAEQAAFFARWGSQLEQVITQQFASVDRKLGRLEFLQAATKTIRSMNFSLVLREPIPPAQLGHFRAVLMVLDVEGHSPLMRTSLAVRSGVPGRRADGEPVASGGIWIKPKPNIGGGEVEEVVEEGEPKEPKISRLTPVQKFTSTLPQEVRVLMAGGGISGWIRSRVSLPTLGQLEENIIAIAVTQPLADHIASVRFTVNEYTVFEADGAELRPYPMSGVQAISMWPDPLTNDEASVPWVRLDLSGYTSYLDFSSKTPKRAFSVDE
jgi:hypothetical protein